MTVEEPATKVQVVIIGSGLAGLSAALTLSDYNSMGGEQVDFVVLEREGRLGGRTFTHPDVDLDLGGAYVGASQNYLNYYLRRFGIKPIPEHLPPNEQWVFEYQDGKIDYLPGDDPQSLPGQLNCAIQLITLDAMALEVRSHLNNPSKSRYAALDGISAQEWLDGERSKFDGKNPQVGMSLETAQAFVCSVRSAFSVEPSELSMFYLLYYAACAGSYSALVDVAGGPGAAEGARLPLGTQELVEKLRLEITRGGELQNIVQGAKVVSIDQNGPGAVVTLEDGRRWKASRVIVAMSPANSGSIGHIATESLADQVEKRRLLEEGMAACKGRTIKGFVRFKRPFWRTMRKGDRNQGLMGFMLSARAFDGLPESYDQSPLDWTLDNVWEDPATGAQRNSLMTFIVGGAADRWVGHTKDERARAVIEHVRRVFPFEDSELEDPSQPLSNYVERNWPGEGAATLLPSPGAMLGKGVFLKCHQALRAPIGVVHYGGSESALEWNGYMSGAVESGIRTANEVLTALGRNLG